MIYQQSLQVVTIHLTLTSTGCDSAETQTLLLSRAWQYFPILKRHVLDTDFFKKQI